VYRSLTILTALVLGLSTAAAGAADLAAIDRRIRKEPAYTGKPTYCLLVFGPDGRERVWLVHDGDTLYVDRNGNGDLTEPGDKVPAAKNAGTAEKEFSFEVGDVTVGGKTHKNLAVWLFPLKRFTDNRSLTDVAVIREAIRAAPDVVVARLNVDVASARFKGAGSGGRVQQLAGFYDLTGVLAFSGKPADAPVVHFDGPLQVNFYGDRPALRVGRDTDVFLAVGTPGRGGGTFSMIAYEDTIPDGVHPKLEVRWPGDAPAMELFDLRQRC
jgi:hypothetical protein